MLNEMTATPMSRQALRPGIDSAARRPIMTSDEQAVATLSQWLALESPTHDAAANNAMQDMILEEVAGEPVTVVRLPGRDGLGDCAVLHDGPDKGRPGLLVVTHVHKIGTSDRKGKEE